MNRNGLKVEGVFNRKCDSTLLIWSGVLGASAVALGAWSAHGLDASHGRRAAELVDTAVRYQLAHALAASLSVALAWARPNRLLSIAGWLFLIGAALFCGALHLLAFGAPRWLGMAAPLGGLALTAGWLALALGGWQIRRSAD